MSVIIDYSHGCDFHLFYGQSRPADYFGVTTEGVSAYMCADCFQDYGIGLGPEIGIELGGTLNE